MKRTRIFIILVCNNQVVRCLLLHQSCISLLNHINNFKITYGNSIESCHNVAQHFGQTDPLTALPVDHAVTANTPHPTHFRSFLPSSFFFVIAYRLMSVQDVYNNFYSRFSSVREYLAPVLKNSKFKETGCITPEEVRNSQGTIGLNTAALNSLVIRVALHLSQP